MTSSPSLTEFTLYFLRLGAVGFGGPIALAGYMQRDLVEVRGWISSEDYREGLAGGAPRDRTKCSRYCYRSGSESQLQSELDLPRLIRLRELAEVRLRPVYDRRSEVRLVQHVEKL